MNGSVKANEVPWSRAHGKVHVLTANSRNVEWIEGRNSNWSNNRNIVTFHINNNNFDIWDLGGDVVSQRFWRTFYQLIKIDIIVYFIGITKEETYEKALHDLLKILNEEALKQSRIFLVFNCFLTKNVMLDEVKLLLK